MTGYFITVPANKLELWMWMESERLLHPVFREFYAERDVVFEERRMRTDSTPLGKFAESFESLFWESHPYGWPVIGWPSDIPAISKAQADEFYGLYYAPQNITLMLVGDFDANQAEQLAAKYFSRIPRGKAEPPDVVTLEVKQVAEKRMYAEAETNPQVDIYWHTVALHTLSCLVWLFHLSWQYWQTIGIVHIIFHSNAGCSFSAQQCCLIFLLMLLIIMV